MNGQGNSRDQREVSLKLNTGNPTIENIRKDFETVRLPARSRRS